MKQLLLFILLLNVAATTAQESFLMGGFSGRIDYKNSDAKVDEKKATFYQLNTLAQSRFSGNKFYVNNGIGTYSGTYSFSGQTISFNTDTVRFDGNTIGYERGVFAFDELEDDLKKDLLIIQGNYSYEERKNKFVLEQEKGPVKVKYRFSLPRRFHSVKFILNWQKERKR